MKLPYNKGGLKLCNIRTKIDAQRVKWLIEAVNSLTDSIDHCLVNENLGVYKHHRYRPPINKIPSITSFYKSCLKSWYDISPTYRVNNQTDIDKKLIYLNPRILNDRRECYYPMKIRPNFTIHVQTSSYDKRL